MEGFGDDMSAALPRDRPVGGASYELSSHSVPRSVKRPRPVKSCIECRTRKLKCDRISPCSQCQKSLRHCKYSPEGQSSIASDGDSDLEPAGRASKRQQSGMVLLDMSPSRPSYPRNWIGLREPGNPGGVDDMALRLERLEHMLRDKHSPGDLISPASIRAQTYQPRTHPAPSTIRMISVKEGARTRFFGQNSPKVLLNLFEDAKEFMKIMPTAEGFRDIFAGLQNVYRALQVEYRASIEPIKAIVESPSPVQKRMIDLLPNKMACDRLLESYLTTGEGIFRILHIPSFRREYDKYWDGQEYSESFLPRLLCMLAIASSSAAESPPLGSGNSEVIHAATVAALVRSWLDSLRGKQLVDFTTLQAEVLILYAQKFIAPRSQDHWTQLGSVVRMAMTMGLHRDPSEFPQITIFGGEIRRRLWFTIMDMDVHVSLACSLPTVVRYGEYSCQPPRNLDDEELAPDMKELPKSKPMDQPTNSQLQSYAASTLPWRMRVASILARIDTVYDYSEVLEIAGKLEGILDDVSCLFPRQYSPDPLQRYKDWRLRFHLDVQVRQALLALYRPFALSTSNCPAQISAGYLKSSMCVLSYMDELDPQIPGFQDIIQRYRLLLKPDILQAAFSLCFFIKNAPGNTSNGSSDRLDAGASRHIPNLSPALSEVPSHSSSDRRLLWSTPVLAKAVEHAVDMLISVVEDSTSDLREIIALSIVLNSVRSASPEERRDQTKTGVRKILESMIQILHAKSSRQEVAITSMTTGSALPPNLNAQRQAAHNMYDIAEPMSMPFVAQDFFQPNVADDFPQWDNFWDAWNPANTSLDGA